MQGIDMGENELILRFFFFFQSVHYETPLKIIVWLVVYSSVLGIMASAAFNSVFNSFLKH